MFTGRSRSNRRGNCESFAGILDRNASINAMFQVDISVEVKGSDEYRLSSLVSFVSSTVPF